MYYSTASFWDINIRETLCLKLIENKIKDGIKIKNIFDQTLNLKSMDYSTACDVNCLLNMYHQYNSLTIKIE